MKIFSRFLILAVLLGCLMTLGTLHVSAALTQKTVLVLSPFQLDLSVNLIAAQAMREEFGKATTTDLSFEVYYEYLDLNRFPGSAYQQIIFDLLTAKYKNKPVDLVIIGSEVMLDLWLAHGAEILPNTPIVFFDVFTEHLDAFNLPANMTGVSGVEDCEKSIQWVLGATPFVNEIVLVGGVGKIEQGFFDHIQKLQDDNTGRIKFTNLSGLSLAEIKQQVAILPKTSVILYHPMFEDAQGTKYHPLDVLRELTKVSSAPVISGYDQLIGTGIIGGYMYSIDQQARDAVQIGLRVLGGEAISSISIAQNGSNRFIFDHLALQRFDIPLSLLPPDSMIKNRQYTFWEQYRTQIILVAAGFALLLILVVVLGITTQRLNKAHSELSSLNSDLESRIQERTTALSQTNRDLELEISERIQAEERLRENERRLSTLMSNLPGMAYRCRNDRYWTMDFVSEGCQDLAGYAPADLIDNRVIAFGQLIHPDDQGQVWDCVQAALQTQTAYNMVYRIKTATGIEKWVMERGRGVFTERGELLALEGFISDITQQKYIEQSLQHAHAESEIRVHERTQELSQATEALLQNEINFEAVVNNASDGILIASNTGMTVFANARFAEMVGYPLAEISQTTLKDLAHPNEYPMLADRLRRRIAGEPVPNQYETAVLHKDGRTVPIEITAAKTVWRGQPADLVIIRDITERKQSEKLLSIRLRLMELAETHSLEEFLQKTLDEVCELVDSPVGFYHLVDEDQVTISLQAWSTLTEKEFCNAAGKGSHYSIDRAGVWADAAYERHPVIHNDYAALLHKKGLPEGHVDLNSELVVPILREDKVVAVLGVGNKTTRYTDQDIELVSYLADVAWEITARKQIERELLQHRNYLEQLVQARTADLVIANERLAEEIQERKINLAKFTTLFDAFPLGITVADVDGKIIESNLEAENILGISRQEQEKRTVDGSDWLIIRPDGTPMPPEEFASVRAQKDQCRVENVEMGIVKDNQEITWINVTAAPIPAQGLGVAVVYSDITERKRTEEKLRESEARYRLLAENVSDVIWILDLETMRFNYISPSILRLSGFTPEEELNKNIQEIMTVESFKRIAAELPRRLKEFARGDRSQRVRTDQIDQFRKDGSIVPTEVVTTLLTNARGQVAQLLGVSRDITKRKQMEEELRENERRTSTILRLSPIVIGVSTVAEGLYTDVNDAFERVLGYSRAETLGRTSAELNLWVDDEARSNILRQIQAQGRVENLEIRLRRKSGEIFPALVFLTPINLHDIPCLLTMMMDITERKRADEELRETRDALQTIIYSAPLAILALDAEDRVTMWNPAAEEMFGWSDKQILGQANPTVPESKSKEYDALRQATLNGMAFSNLDTVRMKKDGKQIPVSLSVAPLRGQHSQVIGRLHVLADITERKKLQEELRQQATTDELTKVSNRRHFLELANMEIKRAVRLKRSPAFALIDIDHFKQINDSYGHAAGDLALVGFTKICQKQIREIDVFARFGGDEFVLLLPETNQEQAYEVVERIRRALAAHPIEVAGKSVAFTISAGITSFSGEESFDRIISQADQALYTAKAAGRNAVVRYDKMNA